MKRRISSQLDIKKGDVRTLVITPKQPGIGRPCSTRKTRPSTQGPVVFHRYTSTLRESARNKNDLLAGTLQCRRCFDPPPQPNRLTHKRPSTAKRSQLSMSLKRQAPEAPTSRKVPHSDPSGPSQPATLNDYLFGSELGRGAYATVRSAIHKKTKKRVALKIYEKAALQDLNRQRSVDREMRILARLSHPNIVKLFTVIEDDTRLVLVMEYVAGESLRTILRRRPHRKLNEYEARSIFRGVLEALDYCHARGVSHRDIKLENVLVDRSNRVKLIDFGFATCLPLAEKSRLFCGTPSYMAPEIVQRIDHCGPPADIWACGVLLFAILTGTFPFKGVNDQDLFAKVSSGAYPAPEFLPAGARHLIEKMLQTVPEARPSAREILLDGWIGPNVKVIKPLFNKELHLNSSMSMVPKKQASTKHFPGSIEVPFLTTDIDL